MALRNSEIIAAELLGNACANNANVREEMGKLGAVRLVVRLLRRVAGGPACVHPRIIHRLFAIPRICLCLLIRFLVRAPTNDLHLAGDGNEGSGEACRIATRTLLVMCENCESNCLQASSNGASTILLALVVFVCVLILRCTLCHVFHVCVGV